MTTRLLFYFFATFFSALGAGVSDSLTAEGWIRLLVLSFAAACGAVVAYLDRTSSGPKDPPAPTNWSGATLLALLTLPFVLSGCATKVFGPDGRPQMVIYADATNFRFRGPGTELSADRLNHSTPTKAGTAGVTSAITAVGAAAAGIK